MPKSFDFTPLPLPNVLPKTLINAQPTREPRTQAETQPTRAQAETETQPTRTQAETHPTRTQAETETQPTRTQAETQTPDQWPHHRILLLAGEASGDMLGGALLGALAKAQQTRRIRISVAGTGGQAMARAGLKSLLPLARFNYMGIGSVIANLPSILLAVGAVKGATERAMQQDDGLSAIIGIDAQAYTKRVQLLARGTNTRAIQVVAPTVWAWHRNRAQKLNGVIDRLLCLYPFEPPIFERHGVAATFVGHPLMRGAVPGQSGAFRAKFGIDPGKCLVALLPGSRKAEVNTLMPRFAKAIAMVSEQSKGSAFNIQVAIPVAPMVRDHVHYLARRYCPNAILIDQEADKWDLFADANAALCCAGTAVLELALARTPMVVGFRQDALTNVIVSRAWRGFVSIVNINAGEKVHPEFSFFECTPSALAQGLAPLLADAKMARTIGDQQHQAVQQMGLWDEKGHIQSPADTAANVIIDELLSVPGG